MNEVEGVGDILTGGILAREVEHGGMPGAAQGDHAAHGGACLNCGTTLSGHFCAECGQPAHVHKTMMSIVHDILHGVFHFEGKFWSTLPLLVMHPGALTRRYIDGERARFVSPMALFLFSVFLLSAAVNRVAMPDVSGLGQGIASIQDQMSDNVDKLTDKLESLKEKKGDTLEDNPKADTRQIDQQIKQAQADIAALKNISTQMKGLTPTEQAARWNDFSQQQTSKWTKIGDAIAAKETGDAMNAAEPALKQADHAVNPIDATGLGRQIKFIRENPELYAYKLKMASYKYSWALIPISVPLIWLLFLWKPQFGAYDHAIFAIYSLSFMTLLAVGLIGLYLLGVMGGLLFLAATIVPPIHMYKQLKGAYRLRRVSAAWRTAALLVMTSIAGSLFFAFILWLEAD